MSFDPTEWLEARAAEVEGWLRDWTRRLADDPLVPEGLSEAMSYALLAGGKRLRPALVIASARAIGGERSGAPGARPLLLRDACCAVELIHNYSLIHDDLPAMDDDDLRRGRPTCHRVHGEAMAILAGDALLTDAFSILAGSEVHGTEGGEDRGARLRLTARLARAAGSAGMVGGQAMDIARIAAGKDLAEVEKVHRLKTGALFAFSCAAGAEAVDAPAEAVERLARFGETIGLAFQVADDILDETGDAGSMGKRVGKDRERDTATVTRAIGLEAARARADELIARAMDLVPAEGERTRPLLALAERLVRRRA